MDTNIVPQSKAERIAFVDQMFVGIQPADNKTLTLTEQLKPLRGALMAKRRQGYNYTQIAAALKASKLKCDVSPSMIKLILASPAAKRRAKIKKLAAQRAANLAAAKPPLSAATSTPAK